MKGLRGILPGLIVATLIGGALRLAQLGVVPVALYCDESFSGYEAWCLLHTAKDSRGVLLPLFFDIFGMGWGEPLYIYLTALAEALFGLTPFSARFVAAMAGTLAIPSTGLMTAALVREPMGEARAARAGAAAAFLMAISPWAFHLSRVAFQASLLPLMLAAGFWLAARALSESRPPRPGLLAGAAFLLGLSLYTYTVARLAMPLLLAGFFWTHRRRLRHLERPARRLVPAALILAALAAPIVIFSFTPQGRQRFGDVSIFSIKDPAARSATALASLAASNYLSYFSPRFLLTEGDSNLRHSIRGHGMLHPHDLLLLGIGAAVCLAVRSRGSLFALWWLATYPMAAALTIEPRHAVRSICGLPGLYAIAGVGASILWSATTASAARPRRVLARTLAALMIVLSAIPVLGYFKDYFVEYPVYSGPAWQYGLKQAYEFVEEHRGDHDSVFVTRYEDHPSSQLLFYRAIPPRDYQQKRFWGTGYQFGKERWQPGPGQMRPIFIWKPLEVPASGIEIRHVVKYPDGTDAFVIAW